MLHIDVLLPVINVITNYGVSISIIGSKVGHIFILNDVTHRCPIARYTLEWNGVVEQRSKPMMFEMNMPKNFSH